MKAAPLLACLLIVSSCDRGRQAHQPSESATTSAFVLANEADQAAAANLSVGYTEAQNCFIDVAMQTMEPDESSRSFSVNPEMVDTFKLQAIAQGRLVGKTEAQVMADLRKAVAEAAAAAERMSQSQKEKYILDTNAHAISCLKAKRAELTQQAPPAPVRGSVQDGGEGARRVRCALTEAESQKVFEDFVRLEDRAGKNNAANEVAVGRSNQISAVCVRQTMIAGLESGRNPPEPQ